MAWRLLWVILSDRTVDLLVCGRAVEWQAICIGIEESSVVWRQYTSRHRNQLLVGGVTNQISGCLYARNVLDYTCTYYVTYNKLFPGILRSSVLLYDFDTVSVKHPNTEVQILIYWSGLASNRRCDCAGRGWQKALSGYPTPAWSQKALSAHPTPHDHNVWFKATFVSGH